MPIFGPMEVAIVLMMALLPSNPKRLPETGRWIGRGLRELRDSVAATTRPAASSPRRRTMISRSGATPRGGRRSSITVCGTPQPMVRGRQGVPDCRAARVPA